MKKQGFTLVELLVVIAIITILAATVVPRVQNWISRGRMARAASEIKGAELALTKMLADADKRHFGQFFEPSLAITMTSAITNAQGTYSLYTQIFYELLRRGRDVEFGDLPLGLSLKPEVKRKLGTTYMDLGKDPWGNNYQFYAGPCPHIPSTQWLLASDIPQADYWKIVPWRSFRGRQPGVEFNDFNWTLEVRNSEEFKNSFGKPTADSQPGYPAPWDLPVYMYSYGENGVCDQNWHPDTQAAEEGSHDGGDDINNWDSQSGWSPFY